MAHKSRSEAKTKSENGLSSIAPGDPDRTRRPASKNEANVGRRAELLDHERAIGRPITYAGDRHPMQSAPDHGPHK
jgi:hypothetical protein